MAKRVLCNLVVVAVLLVAIVTSVPAQVPTGTINGLFSDPHDALVPSAHVVAISKAQGVSRETSSRIRVARYSLHYAASAVINS